MDMTQRNDKSNKKNRDVTDLLEFASESGLFSYTSQYPLSLNLLREWYTHAQCLHFKEMKF